MIEAIKKNIKNKKLLWSNVLLTIFCLGFVMLFMRIFGENNVLIGACALNGVLMHKYMHLNYKLKETPWICIAVLGFIPIATTLASLHPVLGLAINFGYVVLLMFIVTEQVETKAYITFILAYVFIQGNPVPLSELPLRIASCVFTGVLIGATIYYYHHKSDVSSTVSVKDSLFEKNKDKTRVNFAIKMGLALSSSMFIGHIFDIEKIMWISIAAMSLTQPTFFETQTKVKQRFIGTIAGTIAFIVIYGILVPEQYAFIAVVILCYLYNFLESYQTKMAFVACNALHASMIIFNVPEAIFIRFSFLILGTFIAYLIGKAYLATQSNTSVQTAQ